MPIGGQLVDAAQQRHVRLLDSGVAYVQDVVDAALDAAQQRHIHVRLLAVEVAYVQDAAFVQERGAGGQGGEAEGEEGEGADPRRTRACS